MFAFLSRSRRVCTSVVLGSMLVVANLAVAGRLSAQARRYSAPGMGARSQFSLPPHTAGVIRDNIVSHGLNLTPIQVDQIRAIDARYEPELRALLMDHPKFASQAYRDAHNAKFRAWKERRSADIGAPLTPTQKRRLDANMRSLRAWRAARIGRAGTNSAR